MQGSESRTVGRSTATRAGDAAPRPGRSVASPLTGGGVKQEMASKSELYDRRSHFRELLDALPAAIYTTDAAGVITSYNQAAVEFSGRTPEIGNDQWCVTWRLYWPDGRPMARGECPMARALNEDRPIRGGEAIAERPDGTRVPFMAYPTPLHDGSGRLVGAVNMLVDLTAAKEVDEARNRLNEILEQRVQERTRQLTEALTRLSESERRFRLFVGGVTDYAIYMLDTDGVITNWNAGAERIKGYRATEIIGQHFSVFYSPKDREDGLPQRALMTAAREGRFEVEGLAHTQGWFAVLGQRDYRRGPRRYR